MAALKADPGRIGLDSLQKEEDLPADFDEQREVYYQALSQTLDTDEFIASLQGRMQEALASLDRGIPKNI